MTPVCHLDADCFYVSAERSRHSDLIGKPVGVIGNQGACVIAKSYEMRAKGVKTGEAVWDAIVKCPDGIYLKRDFRWYEVKSRQMLDIVKKHSPGAEYYSIDEFFFHINKPHDQASLIQARIMAEAGLPVTLGIGRTRTLAKLFSDTAKPFGIRIALDEASERDLVAKVAVSEISGIGSRRAAKLADRGIHTCLDFAMADRSLIRALLTKTGEDLWWELRGTPVSPIRPDRPFHQHISRGGSIGGSSADPNVIRGWLARNTERLIEELEFHEVKAGQLVLSLATKEGEYLSANAPLESTTDRFDALLAGLLKALSRCWSPGISITHMHLIAGQLRKVGFVQKSMFDPPEEPAVTLAASRRQINDRHGRFAVRSGATLYLPELYRDRSHEFDICDVRGKICF